MKKILYVDDDPAIRETMQMYFEFNEYPIQVAEEGNDALSKLEKEYFDVVITDINMPNGMGGIDFINKLIEKGIEIPILVVSGYLNNDELVKKIGKKVLYFNKPIDFDTLIKAIDAT